MTIDNLLIVIVILISKFIKLINYLITHLDSQSELEVRSVNGEDQINNNLLLFSSFQAGHLYYPGLYALLQVMLEIGHTPHITSEEGVQK